MRKLEYDKTVDNFVTTYYHDIEYIFNNGIQYEDELRSILYFMTNMSCYQPNFIVNLCSMNRIYDTLTEAIVFINYKLLKKYSIPEILLELDTLKLTNRWLDIDDIIIEILNKNKCLINIFNKGLNFKNLFEKSKFILNNDFIFSPKALISIITNYIKDNGQENNEAIKDVFGTEYFKTIVENYFSEMSAKEFSKFMKDLEKFSPYDDIKEYILKNINLSNEKLIEYIVFYITSSLNLEHYKNAKDSFKNLIFFREKFCSSEMLIALYNQLKTKFSSISLLDNIFKTIIHYMDISLKDFPEANLYIDLS